MKKPDNIALGERIHHLRDHLGLSQKEFAARLGVTRGAVGNWEIGTGAKRRSLEDIVDAFHCDRQWLYLGTGVPFPKGSIDAKLAKLPADEAEYYSIAINFMLDLRLRLDAMRKAGITSLDAQAPLLRWQWEKPFEGKIT